MKTRQITPPTGSKPFKLPAIALAAAGSVDAAPSVPDWVMIFPAGLSHTTDGRFYRNNDPEGAIARTEEIGLFIPADIVHGMEYGSPEPSMGWVEEYEVREGAIWGRVEWTDLGREKILSKHYRYISPAFETDEEFNLLSFSSIALVNQPAFSMPALASAKPKATALASQNPSPTETPMTEEELAKFRKIFKLSDDADEAAVQAAIDAAAKAVDAEPDADADADAEVAAVAEAAAADAAAAANALPENPDPEHFVHRADYDAAVARLDALAANDGDAPSEDEISGVVEAAVASGRIAPATKAHHGAMCSTRKGFDNFKAMVKVSPKIVPTDKSTTALASKSLGKSALTENQKAMCARMGLDEKAYASTLKNAN